MQTNQDNASEEDQNSEISEEEYRSRDFDSSEELMEKAFDIEECNDSEAIEAVNYLLSVRKQAEVAPKYTSTDLVFEEKQTDQKYIVQSEIVLKDLNFDTNWQIEVINNFRDARNNLKVTLNWKKQISEQAFLDSLVDLDKKIEQSLRQGTRNKKIFYKNILNSTTEHLLPTLNFLINLQFFQAVNLIEWIAERFSSLDQVSYPILFWIYSILLILQPPLDSDTTSNLNVILKKLLNLYKKTEEDKGMYATIIQIIKTDYNQYFYN